MGCSPWGRKESDTTEQLQCHFQFLHIRLYILDILFSVCFYFVKFYSYILRDDAFS